MSRVTCSRRGCTTNQKGCKGIKRGCKGIKRGVRRSKRGVRGYVPYKYKQMSLHIDRGGGVDY